MSFSTGVRNLNRVLSIFRKGQLIIKDSEKVKDVFDRQQAKKADVEKYLGQTRPTRNRYKKLEI